MPSSQYSQTLHCINKTTSLLLPKHNCWGGTCWSMKLRAWLSSVADKLNNVTPLNNTHDHLPPWGLYGNQTATYCSLTLHTFTWRIYSNLTHVPLATTNCCSVICRSTSPAPGWRRRPLLQQPVAAGWTSLVHLAAPTILTGNLASIGDLVGLIIHCLTINLWHWLDRIAYHMRV